MNTTSYLLLRLGIGASMFGHGLVRLPKLEKFSGWMVGQFKQSMLPELLVKPFSYALPIAEFLVGILLITGLFTRQASVLGGIVMLSLIFGTTMIEGWDFLTGQLVHLVFFAVLLQFIASNTYALDNLLKHS